MQKEEIPNVHMDTTNDKEFNLTLQINNFKASLVEFNKLVEQTTAQKKEERAGLFIPKEGKMGDDREVQLEMLIRTGRCFRSSERGSLV